VSVVVEVAGHDCRTEPGLARLVVADQRQRLLGQDLATAGAQAVVHAAGFQVARNVKTGNSHDNGEVRRAGGRPVSGTKSKDESRDDGDPEQSPARIRCGGHTSTVLAAHCYCRDRAIVLRASHRSEMA
jgi:hypothetical protein